MRQNKILMGFFCLVILAGNSSAEENKKGFSLLTNQSLRLNGFTQVEYGHLENSTDGFRIRRARLSLGGEILRNIHYKLQVDAVKSPILLDAQIEIHLKTQVKLRFGQFKVPFSLENLTSSSALDTISRSQTVEKLCPGRDIRASGRDIGVILNGGFSWVEYALGIFNGSGINQNDSNEQKDIAGRLVFYPVDSLSFGLSYYRGGYSLQQGGPILDKKRTGLEIAFVQKKLSLKGEYIFASDENDERNGWYVQGGYALILERIQAIVKYDSVDKNADILEGRIEAITIGLNWFFSKNTKLQINYVYNKEGTKELAKSTLLAQFQAGF